MFNIFIGSNILKTITMKNCKGLPPMELDSFRYSGDLVSALSLTFPGIPDRERTSLGSGCRFVLGGCV